MNLTVDLVHGTEREIATKEQLLALLKKYDLSKWLFTKRVRIEEGATPHSHPVLTLNTRHLGDDTRLLSVFIHEQLHWFVSKRFQQTKAAIDELRTLYPQVPGEQPQGARTEESTYLHLIVCYLEYCTLTELVGIEKATKVLESLPYYRWIYKTVRTDTKRIKDIIQRYKLMP